MKLFATLCALLLTLGLAAQITVTAATFPAPGDTLRSAVRFQPSTITVTPPGGNQTWDFTSLVTPEFPIETIYAGTAGTGFDTIAPNANVTSSLVAGTNFYRSTDDAFELLAIAGDGATVDSLFAGITFNTQFQPAQVERHGDLEFFEVFNEESNSLNAFSTAVLPDTIVDILPVLPDSIRIRVNFSRTDLVDGWGTLAIPGGVFPVLREQRTEVRTTAVEALLPFIGWLDITDQLPDALSSITDPVTTVSYHFWNDTEKEPIAVIRLEGEADSEVQSVQFKWIESAVGTVEALPFALETSVYPNPFAEVLWLEFRSELPLDGRAELLDATGRLVHTRRFSRSNGARLNFATGALPAGVYFVRLLGADGRLLARELVVK